SAQKIIGVDQRHSGDQVELVCVVRGGPEAVPVKLLPRPYLQIDERTQHKQHKGGDQEALFAHWARAMQKVLQKKRPAVRTPFTVLSLCGTVWLCGASCPGWFRAAAPWLSWALWNSRAWPALPESWRWWHWQLSSARAFWR